MERKENPPFMPALSFASRDDLEESGVVERIATAWENAPKWREVALRGHVCHVICVDSLQRQEPTNRHTVSGPSHTHQMAPPFFLIIQQGHCRGCRDNKNWAAFPSCREETRGADYPLPTVHLLSRTFSSDVTPTNHQPRRAWPTGYISWEVGFSLPVIVVKTWFFMAGLVNVKT